jgi:hypothetical protein
MNVRFRIAGAEDGRWMAPRLRPEDRRESETVTGRPPEETLPDAIRKSRFAYTMHMEQSPHPFAVFGCSDHPRIAGLGVVWFLGTPEIAWARKAVLEVSPRLLKAFLMFYPKGITNYIDSRNALHLKWVKKLGFTVSKGPTIRNVQFYTIYHRGTHV